MKINLPIAFAYLIGCTIVSPTLAQDPQPSSIVVTAPDDFTIELVAAPPFVERPITAALDDQGRLYVGDSCGSSSPIKQQLEELQHRIIRLEDINGDGVYDKSQIFADRMMFPEGTMFYNGSLYVSAPPSIWKLTDTDNDGIADQREEWFQGKTLTGCANDLHGPYLGPDGFIYWCKGAFAEQTHQVNGREWITRASHIFRCRPDRTGLEPVMTGGMDNPVDVVFMPTGERFFTSTFLVHPGNGNRDGIARAIYGGVHGKDHGVLEEHPRTGNLMPVLVHMGAAAPCGLHRYEFDGWGGEYCDNIFACQFSLRKVSRYVFRPDGASFVAEHHDFIKSDHVDFHPTDVVADADGSLLVVNTGGWYKICCPTSQLWKPDVLGGIYRVRKKDAKQFNDPRGSGIDWSNLGLVELWKLFADDRPAVRERATREFTSPPRSADHGQFLATLTLKDGVNVGDGETAALTRVWALGQINNEQSQPVITQLLKHSNAEIRRVAAQVVSLHRQESAFDPLVDMLRTEGPANQRIAAEALGRIANQDAVPHLLAAAAKANDRALQHSIIYALIELADAEVTHSGLVNSEPKTQAAALIAIDQMPGGILLPSQIVPLLNSSDDVLDDTAHWLISRHPEWGSELADWFHQQLVQADDVEIANTKPGSYPRLETLLVRFASHPSIQEVVANAVTNSDLSSEVRQLALRAMGRAKPTPTPSIWLDALTRLIDQRYSDLQKQALSTAIQLAPPKEPHQDLDRALLVVADSIQIPTEPRVQALSMLSERISNIQPTHFNLLIDSLSDDASVSLRSAAADAISAAHLSAEQLDQLCELTKTAGPLEVNGLLDPFAHTTDDRLGLKLIGALKQCQALPALRIEILRENLAKYGPSVQRGIDELHGLVNVNLEAQKAKIAELWPHMENGNVHRGHAVYYSSKAVCSACHRLGYLGGTTGPDLSRIGEVRTKQDLLESIVFPSLNFVRSYEPVVVATADGRLINGLIRDETSTEILLSTGPNEEKRLQKIDIEEIQPSSVSVMPAGLDKKLTVQELADLVAFLKSPKQ